MQVFKAYFKILKSIYPILIIYVIIFFGISILASSSNVSTTSNDFTAMKPKIVLINYDEKTPLINSFEQYLNKNTTIIDIEDNEEELSDALFYRRVYYIIKIPKNFTSSFMSGDYLKLETLKVPDSTTSIYVESLLNKFLNNARLYAVSGIDEQTLCDNINKNLELDVNVDFKQVEKKSSNLSSINYYYNFTNYVFLALIILVVGLIMQAFNEVNIKRRNLSSPIKISSINMQLMLGNLSITLIIWLLFVIGSFVLYGGTMLSSNGLLFILNSLIFILSALSIGFLIGNLVKNTEAQSAIANVISLGSSFMCGAFVPQMFLSKSVLLIGSILPSYWFIKANDIIGSVNNFTDKHINVILACMAIQLAFTFVIYFLTFIITRYKRTRI